MITEADFVCGGVDESVAVKVTTVKSLGQGATLTEVPLPSGVVE